MFVGDLKGDGTTSGQVAEGGVAYIGAPFMAPLVCAPCLHTTKEEESEKHSATGNYVWVTVWSSEELLPPQWSVRGRMADHTSTLSDGATAAQNGGRLRRGSNSSGLDKDVEETCQGVGGEVNLGERWFNLETSSSERRALFRLEREMEATLMFEHGESRRASQLWVTRILLGWLFRERLSLGRAVKSYAKFQRREMMRELVKLNELEEVAEPPLGGLLEASASSMPKDFVQDLDEDIVALDEEGEEA